MCELMIEYLWGDISTQIGYITRYGRIPKDYSHTVDLENTHYPPKYLISPNIFKKTFKKLLQKTWLCVKISTKRPTFFSNRNIPGLIFFIYLTKFRFSTSIFDVFSFDLRFRIFS